MKAIRLHSFAMAARCRFRKNANRTAIAWCRPKACRTAAERDALSARPLARAMGAERLYVSATPSRRTIDFYLRLGFTVSPSPDPELYALEPEDIHLEGPTA